jgi:hypothetical protein
LRLQDLRCNCCCFSQNAILFTKGGVKVKRMQGQAVRVKTNDVGPYFHHSPVGEREVYGGGGNVHTPP